MKIRLENTIATIHIGGTDHLYGDVQQELVKFLTIPDNQAYFKMKYAKNRYKPVFEKTFINKRNQIPSGLVELVYEWAIDLGLKVDIVDERTNLPIFQNDINYILDGNENKYDLTKYPYDHQGRALEKTIKKHLGKIFYPNGILDFATNAGKTSYCYALHNNLIEGQRTLYLIHNRSLYKQLLKWVRTNFGFCGAVGENECTVGNFTIAMQKTLSNRLEDNDYIKSEVKKGFNLLIVDECHKAAGKGYAKLIKQLNIASKIFVSGTPLVMKDNVKKLTVVSLSGKVIDKITKKELINKGVSEKVNVVMLKNKPDLTYKAKNLKLHAVNYNDIVRLGIYQNKNRVEIVANWLKDNANDKYILVSFRDIENGHGNLLYDTFCKYFGTEKVSYIYGSMQRDKRQIEEANFINKKTQIMIASTVWKEGLNIPHIEVLHYATGGMDKISLSQLSGRVERKNNNKGVYIVDVYDDCRILEDHSKARLRFYKKEEFNINSLYEADRNFYPKK